MATFKDLYTHLNLLASEEDGDDFQVMAKREINFKTILMIDPLA